MSDTDWLESLTFEDLVIEAKKPKRKKAPKPSGPSQLTPSAPKGETYKRMQVSGEERVPGERYGFRQLKLEDVQPTGPDKLRDAVIVDGKFVRNHMVKWLPKNLEAATYHALHFQGVSPIWPSLHGPFLRNLETYL